MKSIYHYKMKTLPSMDDRHSVSACAPKLVVNQTQTRDRGLTNHDVHHFVERCV